MRALVPVAVVAIIAVVVLVIWLTANRQKVRRDQLAGLQAAVTRQQHLIDDIRSEVTVQLAAGNSSFEHTLDLITAHDRKEIAA